LIEEFAAALFRVLASGLYRGGAGDVAGLSDERLDGEEADREREDDLLHCDSVPSNFSRHWRVANSVGPFSMEGHRHN